MTIHEGNSLRDLADIIADMRGHTGTRELTEAELQVAYSERPSPQRSPMVQRGNLQTACFALNNIAPEIMAEFLADYLVGRFDRVRASFIGRELAEIAETRK